MEGLGDPCTYTCTPAATAVRHWYVLLLAGVPLPPDPEDPSMQQQVLATPTELFTFTNLDFHNGTMKGKLA